MEDEQLADLARQVYERHKEAFDFVFDKRPQPDSLLDGIKALFTDSADLIAGRPAPMIFRFAPKDWLAVKEFNSCPESGWTHTKRNLLFEIKAYRDTDRISAALISGPADSSLRSKIYEFASSRPKLFIGRVKPMGAQTATIFMKDLLSAQSAAAMEREEKREAVAKAWTEFVSTDLPALKSELASLFE